MNTLRTMQFATPIHPFDHFATMNRDKLPFHDKTTYTTHSNDTVKVTNVSTPIRQTELNRRLSTATYRPTGQDIICGRGRGSFLHEGNKVYLSLLRRNVKTYLAAEKRVQKSVIISTIVSSLKERGFQFLKQDEKNERWFELSETEAYERTAHAIRDLIRKQKGRNKKSLSSKGTSRSPSPSINSDYSVNSDKNDQVSKLSAEEMSAKSSLPVLSIDEQNNIVESLLSSSASTAARLPSEIETTNNPIDIDADSFDEEISGIPSEVMSPKDTLKTGGFDVFFEYDPDDFGRMLSQLDTEKQERQASH